MIEIRPIRPIHQADWEAESGNFKIFVGGSSDNTLESELIFNK